MSRQKRERNLTTNDIVDSERKKPKHAATSSTSRQSITRFEDFADDIIYEIFDYLDAYDIYQSFFKLNTRFQNLLSHINAPIKSSISTFSKSVFQNYYTDFLRPIQHRTKTLHLSDPFIVEHMFPITEDIAIYSQLRILHLENTEPQYLQGLLHRLADLPNLSLLTMHIGSEANVINIFNGLFQLPVLKYCELLFQRNSSLKALPISTNTSSPIEQLIINGCHGFDVIETFLSYAPQLRRLSMTGENGVILLLILFNNSKQYSFTLADVNSNGLEQFVKKYSSEIKLVHFCTMYKMNNNTNMENLLFPSSLPPVKMVLFKDNEEMLSDHSYEIYLPLLSRRLWHLSNIQQWFFTHEPMSEEHLHQILDSFAVHR